MDETTKKIALQFESNAKEVTQQMVDLTASMNKYNEAAAAVKKEQAEVNQQFKAGTIGQEEYDKKMAVLNKDLADMQAGAAKSKSELQMLNKTSLNDLWKGFKDGIKSSKSLTDVVNISKTAFFSLFKMLMANPFMAIAAIIGGVLVKAFDELKKVVKSNDDAGTNFARVLNLLKTPLNVLNRILQPIVAWLGKMAGAVADMATKYLPPFLRTLAKIGNVLGKVLPQFKALASIQETMADTIEQTDAVIKAQDKLEDSEREYTEAHAKREREIAELREKAQDSESFNYAQREQFLKDAAKLEEEDAEHRKQLVNEKIALFELETAGQASLSDEQKSKRTELNVALEEANRDLANAERKLNKELRGIQKQRNTDAAAANKEQTRQAEEEAKRRAELIRQATATIGDVEREVLVQAAEETKSYQEAFDLLVYDYDKKINELETERRKYLAELNDATKEYTEEEKKTLNEAINAIEDKQNILLDQFDKANDTLIEKMRGTTSIEKLLNEQRIAQIKDDNERELAQAELAHNNEIQALKDTYTIEQQETDAFHELLLAKEQEFNDKKAEINQRYAEKKAEEDKRQREAERVAVENEIKSRLDLMDSVGGLFGSIASMYADEYQSIIAGKDELSEQEKQQAVAALERQKTATIAQMALQQAVSIGNAITAATSAASQSGVAAPVVYATTIATIMSGILSSFISAKKAISDIDAQIEEVRSMPTKYATGGYVQGAGTSTSDSIPARLSNGESVINAKSTAMYYDLLSEINKRGGGKAFPNAQNSTIVRFANGGMAMNTKSIIEGIREAVMDIQPIVSVKEITTVQQRVRVKENLL